MTKWILKWNDATDPNTSGEELFDSKEELKDRLDELKEEYGEELEYESGEAVKVTRDIWTLKNSLR